MRKFWWKWDVRMHWALGVGFVMTAAMAFGADTTPAKVTVARVWPEKIVYRPGETATITVALENKSKDALEATVALAIHHGLTARDELPVQPANLTAGGKATLSFSYPVPQGRKWGHEAQATVRDASGELLANGREFFTVGDTRWEVGHYSTLFGIRDGKKNKSIDNSLLPKFRRAYITTIEGYSWQPSVFDDMTPKTEQWRSGQGAYKEGKEDWQYLIQRAHEMGMAVVTYIQSISYGPVGIDFARRHPDWLAYGKDGRPLSAWFDVDALTTWRENPEAQKASTVGGVGCGSFLNSKPEVGEYWIQELIRSAEMFGWDGFRSDGNPGIVEGYDVTGTLQPLPDAGAANAAFLRKVREKLTARFPNFLFGWNNVAGGYPKMYNSEAEEDAMLPGAYSLYEHFRSSNQPNSPYHPWKKAAFYLQQEADAIRARGGFPHAGWMATNRYLEAVASACGQHMDSFGAPPAYRRFEFRWAEFLWDCQLRFVRPGDTAVKVAAPAAVWWQDFVQSRELPDGRTRVLVHLINMPANDDEAWADRAPVPAANIRVAFALPPGKKLIQLVALSPDGAEDVVDAKPATDGSLTVPEVKVWTVVVAEFGAGAPTK